MGLFDELKKKIYCFPIRLSDYFLNISTKCNYKCTLNYILLSDKVLLYIKKIYNFVFNLKIYKNMGNSIPYMNSLQSASNL